MTTIQPSRSSSSCGTRFVLRLKREWMVIADRKDVIIQLISWICFRIIGFGSGFIIGVQLVFTQIGTIIQQMEQCVRSPALPH